MDLKAHEEVLVSAVTKHLLQNVELLLSQKLELVVPEEFPLVNLTMDQVVVGFSHITGFNVT